MALIVAAVAAVVVTPAAGAAARWLDVVDRPGPLKVQERSVPYLGGVAVFVALALPVGATHASWLLPLALALLLGLADDVRELSPRLRLGGQVVIGGCAALVLPVRGPLGAALCVAIVVFLINAVNLLDGLDGLASGVGVCSAVGFAVILDGSGRTLGLALGGALAGFLVWNRPPARIYLGDAGSYLVGASLAMLLSTSFGTGQSASTAAAGALLVGVPTADTCIAVLRRLRARQPLFLGDRAHIYDQLVDDGWSQRQATAACIVAQVLLLIVALTVTPSPAAVAVVVSTMVVIVVAAVLLRLFTTPPKRPA